VYSIVLNFEGKRQSAGKMKKKFSFTKKALCCLFQVSDEKRVKSVFFFIHK
jgi:hypothetical protein